MLVSATKTKFENITNLTTDNIPPRLANAVLSVAETLKIMEIDNIEYHIKPFNDFLQIIIFEENKKFKIGLSFIGNSGTDSFIIFKNLIVGAFGYITNRKDIDTVALMFESYDDCKNYLEKLTPKILKKEFSKGEIKESKFLLAQRF